MSVIAIKYDRGNRRNLGYETVLITNGKETHFFRSGNFVKDWYDCIKYYTTTLNETDLHLSHSSSVDHFIIDGAPYDSAYLIVDEKNKGELFYGENYCNKGIEFFVPKNTRPTWNELKNY
jgi:hypothetical protein